MRRWGLATVVAALWWLGSVAEAAPRVVRCDDHATAELSIDGLLDDWPRRVVARAGTTPDGAIAVRCAWDGTAVAIAVDVEDDRVVRLASKRGHQDHVTVTVSAGGKPAVADVFPGNAVAKARITRTAKVDVADSLQRQGFSIEFLVPASQLAGLVASTPTLALSIVFHDADQATGGDTTEVALTATIELADRKDLLDDFLRAVRLRRSDLKFDQLADLDPDRRGNERVVAGGTVIGVLTDRFAYVTLPAATPADVKKVELLPLGKRGLKVVTALVRQTGNGGGRELLMLWTVWSGQLQPLAQIEMRKQLGGNVLEATWQVKPGRGKAPPELWVEPRPAVGWTAASWNEQAAADVDPIVLPWDARGGVGYTLDGAEVRRRDLPAPKRRRR